MPSLSSSSGSRGGGVVAGSVLSNMKRCVLLLVAVATPNEGFTAGLVVKAEHAPRMRNSAEMVFMVIDYCLDGVLSMIRYRSVVAAV